MASVERALNVVTRTLTTVTWQPSYQSRRIVYVFYNRQNSWKSMEVTCLILWL